MSDTSFSVTTFWPGANNPLIFPVESAVDPDNVADPPITAKRKTAERIYSRDANMSGVRFPQALFASAVQVLPLAPWHSSS